jgi:Rps23 Pro-64 3,4-dihydroxylase Tpa1-like proline 4-hydroxylase
MSAPHAAVANETSLISRELLADCMVAKLTPMVESLRAEFCDPVHKIRAFAVDSIVPDEYAQAINSHFPDPSTMMLKKSLREHKYVAAQMNAYHPQLEEAVYAVQDPRIVDLMTSITGIAGMEPDTNLYAGGISLMAQDNFLNPHLDNSHDKDRQLYRVINLLWYVTPGWKEENGGNLELWDQGPKGPKRTFFSKFNRLVVMETNQHSWHSVSQVVAPGKRCCVSNYYFSPYAPGEKDYFHITAFRGRPEQPIRDMVLRSDIAVRSSLRKLFPTGVVKPTHVYQRDEEPSDK